MNNKEYLLRRCGWIIQVAKSIEDKRNRCLVIDKLNAMNDQKVVGVVSTSYPASFRVRYKDIEKDVMVWVKESKIDYTTPIPYTLVNECKLMGTVIRDMFYPERRSPHFIFPVAQILTNDKKVNEEEMVRAIENGNKGREAELCHSKTNEHLSIFNIMEYAESYVSFKSLMKDIDLSSEEQRADLITSVFQILYNLTVMENMKFRHGDLHLDNILVDIIVEPSKVFKASYIIDEKAAFYVPSMTFTMFIDFDRSIINTGQYKSIPIPDDYLVSKPCSVKNESFIDKEDVKRYKTTADLPYGVVEDCWKTWNPYADLTRFLAHLRIVKPDALMSLFPESTVKNILTLMGTKPFGRQSMRELEEDFSPEFLSKCTPREILKQFAAHHPSFIGVIEDQTLINKERDHVYYV